MMRPFPKTLFLLLSIFLFVGCSNTASKQNTEGSDGSGDATTKGKSHTGTSHDEDESKGTNKDDTLNSETNSDAVDETPHTGTSHDEDESKGTNKDDTLNSETNSDAVDETPHTGTSLDKENTAKRDGSVRETTEEEEEEKGTKTQWFRLINITIPANSVHRQKHYDGPTEAPDVYAIIKQNGVELCSTPAVKGWSVDFPDEIECKFPVRLNSEVTYSIEVWDYDWFGDEHIFNITQQKGEDFSATIVERGRNMDRKLGRLAEVQFKTFEKPQGHQED